MWQHTRTVFLTVYYILITWRNQLSDGSISGCLELCLQVPGTSRFRVSTVYHYFNIKIAEYFFFTSLTIMPNTVSPALQNEIKCLLVIKIHHLLYSNWKRYSIPFKRNVLSKWTHAPSARALTVCFPAGRVKGPRYSIVYLAWPTFGKGSGFVPLIV